MDIKTKIQICKRINCRGNIKYKPEDIKEGLPEKDCECYLVKIIGDNILINFGGYKYGKFFTSHFTSAENHRGDTDFKQTVYHREKENTPDAYILFKL